MTSSSGFKQEAYYSFSGRTPLPLSCLPVHYEHHEPAMMYGSRAINCLLRKREGADVRHSGRCGCSPNQVSGALCMDRQASAYSDVLEWYLRGREACAVVVELRATTGHGTQPGQVLYRTRLTHDPVK